MQRRKSEKQVAKRKRTCLIKNAMQGNKKYNNDYNSHWMP